ncbi:hypothetical protein [Nitrosomonas ureae]|uniref:Uncharacterized protein n=1 Tax=Nitrosomonas ureae TaxID=44577 RepID=A0A1H2HXN4_9PROT|nr:hypothetical protein [Nitrosomonas ureae]ALQ51706.1 hypothetical protein ATY38_11025 [Nitrosomonas ureae]SDU36647.1 hypothetical protein SAMN05216406_1733 [Nitrosomonas ureae]
MNFDPESYSITIRKEEIDDVILYVGRVTEFPNISVYEEDFETARKLIIDAIQTLKKMADETHTDFPRPYLESQVNFVNVHHRLYKADSSLKCNFE